MSKKIEDEIIDVMQQQRRRIERIEEMEQLLETGQYQVPPGSTETGSRLNKPLVSLVVFFFALLFVFLPNIALLLIFAVMFPIGVIQLIRERKRNGRR